MALKENMTLIIISINTEKKNYDKCQDLLQQNYGKGTEDLPTCCKYYACTHTVMVGAGNPVEPRLTGRWVYVHASGGLS